MPAEISILSDARIAGALQFDKDLASLPASPKPGMLVVNNRRLFAYLEISGIETWYPMSGLSSAKIHAQGAESTIWIITHNFNSENVWYHVKNPTGETIVPSGFEVIDRNSIKLTFSTAVLGTAVVVCSDIPSLDWSKITSGKPTTLAEYGITDAQGAIPVGTSGQYYRGDKSWATLDKAAVGLGNVENVSLSSWAGSTNLTTAGNLTAISLTVSGNLTVSGTTTTLNSEVYVVKDPVVTLGGGTAPTLNDGKNRGIEFRWHDGTSAKVGFFGFDPATKRLTFIPDALNSSEVFSGTKGAISALLSWSDVTDKPTTRDGYGITDVPKSDGTGATGTWAVSISGNAATATTAWSIDNVPFTNSNSANPITGADNLTESGLAYVKSVSLFGQTDGGLYAQAFSSAYVHQIFGDYRTGQMAVRSKNNGAWQAWRTVLDSSNFSTWATPIAHASDVTLHLTALQNTFLDQISSTSDIILDSNVTF